jgi:hypothetical protein
MIKFRLLASRRGRATDGLPSTHHNEDKKTESTSTLFFRYTSVFHLLDLHSPIHIDVQEELVLYQASYNRAYLLHPISAQ